MYYTKKFYFPHNFRNTFYEKYEESANLAPRRVLFSIRYAFINHPISSPSRDARRPRLRPRARPPLRSSAFANEASAKCALSSRRVVAARFLQSAARSAVKPAKRAAAVGVFASASSLLYTCERPCACIRARAPIFLSFDPPPGLVVGRAGSQTLP